MVRDCLHINSLRCLLTIAAAVAANPIFSVTIYLPTYTTYTQFM